MPSASDFATADIDKVVNELTTNEAILLTAGGVGFWHTHAVDRLGIPAIKACDCHCLFLICRSSPSRLAMDQVAFEGIISL